jgi:hypothetical protein
MKITISAYTEVIDVDAFLKEFKQNLVKIMMKGAQQFLLEAIPRIPIRTGFARGAFRNLEDVAGAVSAGGGTAKIRGDRGGGSKEIKSREFYRDPKSGRVLKTTQSGRQFATSPNEIFEFAGATVASGRSTMYFRFEVNITYVNVLDKAVWGAFEAGSKAMQDYIEANAKKALPDIAKFTTRRRLV